MPNRLEEIRKVVDAVLVSMTDPVERRCAYIHLYGVSQSAAMLALGRGLDSEIAAVAGMCHDLSAYATGVIERHDENGAEYLRPIIRDMEIFSDGEQALILSAISRHSDKSSVNGPYDEVLKDADVLQHYLYNPALPVSPGRMARLQSILAEIHLPIDVGLAK